MRINGFSGTNTQTGTMGMTQGNDSVSKNIQNQIANAQQKLKRKTPDCHRQVCRR